MHGPSPHAPLHTSHYNHNDHLHPNGHHAYDDDRTPSRGEGQYGFSAEDAADDFERSILGDEVPTPTPPPPLVTSTKRKGKGKKRAAQENDRHSGSEAEAPATKKKKKAAVEESATSSAAPPPTKKRRLEKEAISVADDVERSIMGSEPTAPSASAPVKSLKGKGKAKQIKQAEQLQREPSMDSVSTPPVKIRKKPGPKKKLGLAPEVESEIAASSALAVGSTVGSYPPSVSGDVTPRSSRPGSPVPANMSILYDLDEVIPPLKKARKIDDGAMVKRIKSLEEAQKKVWTNIARREVAKVRLGSVFAFTWLT